jgi:hypothetical protein
MPVEATWLPLIGTRVHSVSGPTLGRLCVLARIIHEAADFSESGVIVA